MLAQIDSIKRRALYLKTKKTQNNADNAMLNMDEAAHLWTVDKNIMDCVVRVMKSLFQGHFRPLLT